MTALLYRRTNCPTIFPACACGSAGTSASTRVALIFAYYLSDFMSFVQWRAVFRSNLVSIAFPRCSNCTNTVGFLYLRCFNPRPADRNADGGHEFIRHAFDGSVVGHVPESRRLADAHGYASLRIVEHHVHGPVKSR